MQRGADESMEGNRSFSAFWSNHLKKDHLSSFRSSDLHSAEIMNRLTLVAEVRSNFVARGKALIRKPDYPDARTERKIALLLTEKLRGK